MPKRSSDSEGARRPIRMSEIARIAGVSKSTVSRALADSPVVNPRTRAYVQKIAAEHGYRVNPVARSLRSGQTRIVSVGFPLVHEKEQRLSEPFLMAMLARLADEFTERGYSILLTKVASHENGWIERLAGPQTADGVVVVGQSLEHSTIDSAARQGVPIVVWGAMIEGQSYVTVGSDNRLGGRLAAAHLAANGRQRIAFLGDERLPEVRDRFEGYREALVAAGLGYDDRLRHRIHFHADDAYRGVRAMLAKDFEFDGVVAASDVIAISAIRALVDADRTVPGDVSVVGFDDIPLAEFSHPSLTTIRQDLERGAALIAEKLLTLIQGRETESVVLPPELVVRESA